MPRKPRSTLTDGVLHITARGNRGQAIFEDDLDRQTFLARLRMVGRHQSWSILSYCLMGNHIHLLVESRIEALSLGMKQALGDHARQYNHRHGHAGHLFGGRFWSVPVLDEPQLIQTLRYVAMNPVKAGLCDSPTAWAWGSHRTMMAGGIDPIIALPRLFELLGVPPEGGWKRYTALFDGTAPAAEPARPSITQIRAVLDERDAMVAARQLGYGYREIAAELGRSPSTVLRRCRAA